MADAVKHDVVMQNIGCGKHQVVMFLLCGFCVMAEAVAICSFQFGVSIAVCDLQVNSSYIPWSYGVLSFGAGGGGVVLGALSDAMGRSLALRVSLLVAASGLLAAAFQTTTIGLLCSAMLLGFGWGAVGPAARVYLVEIVTIDGRVWALPLLDFCWVVAYCSSMFAWWESSPLGGARPEKSDMWPLAMWRKGLLGAFAVCVLSACCTFAMRNTPRHLLSRGKMEEARAALRRMFSINKDLPDTKYKAAAGLSQAVQLRPLPAEEEALNCCRRWCGSRPLRVVLSDGATCRGTVAAAVATASSSPGWVPLLLWCSRMQVDAERPAWWLWAGCALDLSPADRRIHELLVKGVVVTMLVLPVAAAPIYPAAGTEAACCLAAGSAISFSMLAVKAPYWLEYVMSVLTTILASQVAVADALLRLTTVEMYPTHSRATMVGLVQFPKRLITAILLMMPAVPCTTLRYVHGGALITGAVAALFLPNLKGQPLVE